MEVSQKPNKLSKPPEIDENNEKTGGVAHVLAYKLPKTKFFTQKYLLNKIYSRDVFRGIQAHYLSHCRVIPLQKFRKSYMPPAARNRVKSSL
jgi:hypothetical protein